MYGIGMEKSCDFKLETRGKEYRKNYADVERFIVLEREREREN